MQVQDSIVLQLDKQRLEVGRRPHINAAPASRLAQRTAEEACLYVDQESPVSINRAKTQMIWSNHLTGTVEYVSFFSQAAWRHWAMGFAKLDSRTSELLFCPSMPRGTRFEPHF
jgi:hypothetical protein